MILGNDSEAIWTFIAEADQPPTTAEIAAALGISTSAARRRLAKLREAGRVECLKLPRITTWRALLIAAEGIAIPVTLVSKPSQIPAGSVSSGSGDNQEDRATGTRSPVSSPAAPDPITIKLSGFAAFEVPADGAWHIFRTFEDYREAERTRFRIVSLGWTPPGTGPRQVKTQPEWAGQRRKVYAVRVRAMPARKPPSKARA